MVEQSLSDALNTLKNQKNITAQIWAEKADVPLSTVNRILRGETAEPSFQTVVRLVRAVGGSLDEVAGLTPPRTVSADDMSRVMRELYEKRVDDAKESAAQHYENAKLDKLHATRSNLMLFALSCLEIVILIIDIMVGNAGWIIR